MSNPNIGVLQVKICVISQGLGPVYCLCFSTLNKAEDIKTFYLSDLGPSLNSDLLIINCINSMLEYKYHNFYQFSHFP